MLLIKRKLVFIFKTASSLETYLQALAGKCHDFMLKLLFFLCNYQVFFKAIYWKCNGFHIVV